MRDRANIRAVKKLEKIAKLVEEKEPLYAVLSDDELASQTAILRERYNNGETLDDLLPDAYAVCREASKRVLKQRHYHVQILGGIALHQGRICQMSTGEGKTLTETLPAYLNALTGKGVHIVTVNEYLATRDMEWMGKIFRFLGLTVGVTLNAQKIPEKQEAYACDITYGTNSEFGFDYLRDNMASRRDRRVQRGLNFAIIDEVDSILIDEARTPLIIAGPSKMSGEYQRAAAFVNTLKESTNVDMEGNVVDENGNSSIVSKLGFGGSSDEKPNGDFVVNFKDKTAHLTDSGIKKAEKWYGINFGEANEVNSQDDVDPDSEEDVVINPFDEDEVSEKIHYIDNALHARTLKIRDVDYIVDNGQVIIVDEFTGRKMYGRRYSKGLHQAIEAKENVEIQRESKTVATITYQNYFRLYQKFSGMTGTAKTEENEFKSTYNIDVVVIPTNRPSQREDYQDRFYRTRKYKLDAIVEEVKQRHEAGQPLLIGTVSVEKSEELALLLKRAGIKGVNVLNAKLHRMEADIIAQAGRYGSVTIATNMAGRGTDILLGGNPEVLAKQAMKKAGYNDAQIAYATDYLANDPELASIKQEYQQKLEVAQKDTELNKQKVLSIGEEIGRNDYSGLCVIGTEKHDSRRIDNQLRGRAGRQGDPGCSIFFLSAEDDIVRIYGRDMVSNMMRRIPGGEDGVPLASRLTSGLMEQIQKRIEGMYFNMRKNVLRYDDVNNTQRKIIYQERNRILDKDDVHEEVLDMCYEYARFILERACGAEEDVEKWNFNAVSKRLAIYLNYPKIKNRKELKKLRLIPKDFNKFKLESEDLTSARDVCNTINEYLRERLDDRYSKEPEYGRKPFSLLEKKYLLGVIDDLWMNHIDELDEMRRGVGLQAIGQHDPLMVYQKEAFEMFEKMNKLIKIQTIDNLLFAPDEMEEVEQKNDDNSDNALTKPCRCGSGKKYKDCCLKKDLALGLIPGVQSKQVEADQPLTEKEINQQKYQQVRQERKEKQIAKKQQNNKKNKKK